jgi:hypothetical protein
MRCLELGARLAEPGEFTRRAYLNGKLDLAQAEAVIDLIDAATKAAARSAVRSLQGEFSKEINQAPRAVDRVACAGGSHPRFSLTKRSIFSKPPMPLGALSASAAAPEARSSRARSKGRLLQGGLHVVLVGQPNVGKSSLLNRLVGDELAIVTPLPGTTRDVVRSTLQVEGIPLHVIDTAGLRETDDEIEKIGIERTWREIERADVVVLLVDARSGVGDAERAILAQFPHRILPTDRIQQDRSRGPSGRTPCRSDAWRIDRCVGQNRRRRRAAAPGIVAHRRLAAGRGCLHRPRTSSACALRQLKSIFPKGASNCHDWNCSPKNSPGAVGAEHDHWRVQRR